MDSSASHTPRWFGWVLGLALASGLFAGVALRIGDAKGIAALAVGAGLAAMVFLIGAGIAISVSLAKGSD